MDIYRRLWGKRRELSDVVFKTVSVPFVDFNNEIEGADTIQSQVAEAEKEFTVLFTVLELGYDFAVFCQDPGMTTLLVREEYELVVKAIGYNRESGAGCGGMQVTGDRGIGKKFCLIYLLVKRLLDQEPTFYQVEHDSAFLFCSQGLQFAGTHVEFGRRALAIDRLELFPLIVAVVVLQRVSKHLCRSSRIACTRSDCMAERKSCCSPCYEPLDMVRGCRRELTSTFAQGHRISS